MNNRKLILLIIFFVVNFSGSTVQLAYAESQSLSVTPPLFQLSIERGDVWQSSIRVVNSNNYPLTVYTKVVNFAPEGEEGRGRFIPILNPDENKATVAEWIEIPEGPYVIPPEQTQEISFFVEVPENAAPGGHFAAILVGTEPSQANETLAVSTSQSVASLFFVRIEGDIIENGSIREFSILDRSIEYPAAEFSLRFENKGNVHLQPRGNIVISNMWGKQRGLIPINNESHFGNVLPESIRDFHFSWKGERSLADIGLYKAILTLGYGEDGIKSTSATAYFWVVPIKGALVTLIVIGLIIASITWMIRRYVRNMLILAGVDPDDTNEFDNELAAKKSTRRPYGRLTAPLEKGALDLRKELKKNSDFFDMVKATLSFVWSYKIFFASLLFVIGSFIITVRYISEVSVSNRTYEVTIDEGDNAKVIKSSDIQNP